MRTRRPHVGHWWRTPKRSHTFSQCTTTATCSLISAEGSRKGGVTFYLWCTGRGIPLHASLFTGRLISGNRSGESNRENESKDRHNSFHGASPSIERGRRKGTGPWLETRTALPCVADLEPLGHSTTENFPERGRARRWHGSLYRQRPVRRASNNHMALE